MYHCAQLHFFSLNQLELGDFDDGAALSFISRSSSRNGENDLYNEQVLFCALPLPSDFCCHLRLARVLLKESCSLVVVLSVLPLYVR